MDDYIDRNALKEKFWDACKNCLSEDDIADLIDDIPAADVAPIVHARWVKIYDDTEPASEARQIAVSCSKCMGILKDKLTELKYCPHCGAKMDKED